MPFPTPPSRPLARRTVLGAAVAAGASLAGFGPARGDAPQLDLLETLNDLSWVADGNAGARFVYVIYAPWCPYCKQLYIETRGLKSSLQIRWIVAGSTNERARRNNIKIASSREPAQLRELFASGDIASETAVVPYAIDLNETVLQALRPALDQLIQRSFGYPTLVFHTTRGPRAQAGTPRSPQTYLQDNVAATTAAPREPASLAWLKRPMREIESLRGKSAVVQRATQVRALPFDDVPVVGSIAPGQSHRATRIVEAEGTSWVSIAFLRNGMRAFVPAEAVELQASA